MLSKRMIDDVGFGFIVEKLECFSYYGKKEIRKISASFLDSNTLQGCGVSTNLETCFQNISKLMVVQSRRIDDVRDLLASFKNIEGIVKKLIKLHLSEVELFELKRFLLALERLAGLWETSKIQLDGIHFVKMTDALNILDSNNQRIAAFSILDVDFPALRAARQEKASIEDLIDKHGLTDELIKQRAEIVAEEDKHEQAVLKELSDKLRPFVPNFMSNIKSIGLLDLTIAKAVLAKQAGAVCPNISSGDFRLVNMWNPKTHAELEKNGRSFIKTSIVLEQGATVLIGANMGGKSLTIKTVLLNVLLANMGFFVFADEAEVPLFDDVFFIEEGKGNDFLSSFGAEIMQINEAVSGTLDKKLFICLDEPARTTNPAEGTKIVKGIVSYLSRQKSTSLISTHYSNVQQNAQAVYQTACFSFDRIDCANANNLENFIKYDLQKVDSNAAIPTEAINLCKMLGMNPALLAEIIK